MTDKEKSNLLRIEVKKLRKRGLKYEELWNFIGMKQSNFYNFTSGKISLKKDEIKLLQEYLKDNYDIKI